MSVLHVPSLYHPVIGLQLQDFSSVPKRTYKVKGIKIRIPHGTTVDINTGRIIYPTNYVFNGTLKAAEFLFYTIS